MATSRNRPRSRPAVAHLTKPLDILVGYTTFSAMLLFYTQVAYLKDRPAST